MGINSDGRDCLAYQDVEGVALVEVVFYFGGKPWQQVVRRSNDVFGLVENGAFKWPEVDRMERATFEMRLAHTRRARRVPTVAVNCRSWTMRCFKSRAIGRASCKAASTSAAWQRADKSAYASSMDICSTTAPVSATSFMTARDSSRYRSIRGRTKTPWGQSLPAVALGMAERTPNFRAS